MIDFDFEQYCVGCEICSVSCHKNAIKMIQTKDGFFIPQVDKDLCVDCGVCSKRCPVLTTDSNAKQNQPIHTLGVALRDKSALFDSASGGAFWGLATEFIKNGGYVAGCVWNNQFQAEYIVTNDISIAAKMRGSKYVQAMPGNIVAQIKQLIANNHKVLLSGTPCQIEGIKNYVGTSDLLYCCGLICEGVASPKVWEVYRACLQKQNKAKLTAVYMRSKKDGWTGGCSEYCFDNGKTKQYHYGFLLDPYISGFIEGLYNRNCCKNCKFKAKFDTMDYLIGDFWGASKEQIQTNQNKGLSTVLICSKKASEHWSTVSDCFDCDPVLYDIVKKANNIEHSGHFSKNRDLIFENIDTVKNINDFEALIWKSSGKYRKKKIMSFLDRLNLFVPMLKILRRK